MKLDMVPRSEIFTRNPYLAKYLSETQEINFNPEDGFVSTGESVYLEFDDDEPTILTAELAKIWNDHHAEYCAAHRDVFEFSLPEMNNEGLIIAELPANDIDQFASSIGKKIGALCTELGWRKILTIPDSVAPVLDQENDFSTVVTATRKLEELGLARDYCAGIILDEKTVGAFFNNLFWVVRCNAGTPNMVFSGENSAIFGILCKYGNIHFECYDESQKKQLTNALNKTGFVISPDGMCHELFSKSGAIEGRRLF